MKKREEQISICFKNTTVDFNYQAAIYEFEKLIENFQGKVETESDSNDNDKDKNNVNNILCGKTKMDKHIVMDNVSGPANKSNKFGSFLSVC